MFWAPCPVSRPKLKPPEGQRGRSLLNCPADQVQRAATRVIWRISLGHGGLVLETKTSSVSTELCLSQGACLPGLLFPPHPPAPAPGLKLCGLASLSPQSVFLTAVSHDTGRGTWSHYPVHIGSLRESQSRGGCSAFSLPATHSGPHLERFPFGQKSGGGVSPQIHP